MGRLRDSYEAPLFQGVSEEVVDLFGNEDGHLYIFDTDESELSKDPLWDEPSFKESYKKYRMPFIIQDFETPVDVGDDGKEPIYQCTITLSRQHLKKAGVEVNELGNMVEAGHIMETFTQGMRIYWWILTTAKKGFINDSDNWSEVVLTCRRTLKFVPERSISVSREPF